MAFARSVALRSGGQRFCGCRAYNFDYVICCGKVLESSLLSNKLSIIQPVLMSI